MRANRDPAPRPSWRRGGSQLSVAGGLGWPAVSLNRMGPAVARATPGNPLGVGTVVRQSSSGRLSPRVSGSRTPTAAPSPGRLLYSPKTQASTCTELGKGRERVSKAGCSMNYFRAWYRVRGETVTFPPCAASSHTHMYTCICARMRVSPYVYTHAYHSTALCAGVYLATRLCTVAPQLSHANTHQDCPYYGGGGRPHRPAPSARTSLRSPARARLSPCRDGELICVADPRIKRQPCS